MTPSGREPTSPTQLMDPLAETSLRNVAEGDEMNPSDRGSRAERESERPSGVHRRCGRVLVIEPDRSARGQWDATAELHHVEFVTRLETLTRALGRPGDPQAVSVALLERADLGCRTALVADLGAVGALRGQRIIIDVRRCDLGTALELLRSGFILCADDEVHRGSAPRAAVNHATMAEELDDGAARTRLAKTLAASAISDQHGLSPSEHRALRGSMDFDQLTKLAAAAALSASTLTTHRSRIRKRVGASAFDDVVRTAQQLAFDATFALGRLIL